MVLVLNFNSFTGKLDHGYWMARATRERMGELLTAVECYRILATNPAISCLPSEF